METATSINVETVQKMYEAFGRGDVPTILDHLHEDVRWIIHMDPIVPWSGDFSGKASVPRFFSAIFESVDVLGFEPGQFIVDGDTVVSLGTFTPRGRKSGKTVTTDWVFIWQFRDGKVASYTQYHDPSISQIF